MSFLHVIFFGLCIVTLAGIFTNLKYKPIYGGIFWGLVVIFFLLSFLRWELGPDWSQYYAFFVENSPPNAGLSFEMGYQYLSYWISNSVGEYTLLLFVQGALLSFCTSLTIWQYSKDPVLSLLVFFAISFAGIYFVRQYVAIAITMFAFQYVVKRQFWKFLLCVLLAAQFHVTAWIFLFAYPLYTWFLSVKKMIILLCVSLVFSLLLMKVILLLLGSLGGFVAAKINTYLELGSDPGATGAASGSLLFMVMKGFVQRSFIFVLICLLLNKQRVKDNVLNGMINFYVFSIVLFACFAPLSIVLARIVNYYEYYVILIVPALVKVPKLRFNRFVVYVLLVFYLYIRFLSGYNQYPKVFAPYRSIFNQEYSSIEA